MVVVRRPVELEAALKERRIQTLINCVGASTGDERALRSANTEAAREIGETCRRLGVRLLHIGSAAEYGLADDDAVPESAPTRPQTAYGRTKLAGTEQLQRLAEKGLDLTVARPFNIVGAGQPLSTPIGEFAASIRCLPETGGGIRVRDSRLVRDFLSRTRVAEMLLDLVQAPGRVPVVNLCSGLGLSFAEFIHAMAKVRGMHVEITNTQPGGIPRIVGDPTLLHSVIGDRTPEDVEKLARVALQPPP